MNLPEFAVRRPVSVFMVFYYFLYGGIAVVALFCNALLILGAAWIIRRERFAEVRNR